ncbi:LOW QUALITY PROTEIN: hypothetical protein U9M48_025316 [Paspalum notatum var. saurae]|uniref:F-box domain-containing protein n=1 Tax=Paspalum notatum var. saurae TaxID=547442 RepID=A0AAQ3TSA6_PASNO
MRGPGTARANARHARGAERGEKRGDREGGGVRSRLAAARRPWRKPSVRGQAPGQEGEESCCPAPGKGQLGDAGIWVRRVSARRPGWRTWRLEQDAASGSAVLSCAAAHAARPVCCRAAGRASWGIFTTLPGGAGRQAAHPPDRCCSARARPPFPTQPVSSACPAGWPSAAGQAGALTERAHGRTGRATAIPPPIPSASERAHRRRLIPGGLDAPSPLPLLPPFLPSFFHTSLDPRSTDGDPVRPPRPPPSPTADGRGPLSIMGENKWMGKRWEDMDTDVLVKIFKELNLVELSPVSQVCRLWRSACSDPLIWGTLDFGLLKSNFIQTRASPYIWVDDRSDKRLARILRVAMAISCGNVNCMIFHYNLYMKDEHLHFISERSPHLKRLVMPAWNRITKAGICQAIRRWQELESLTMPTIGQPPYIIEEIARSCKNFTELKIMGSFDQQFASAILQFLPKLKVLSLRCSKVAMDALHCLLNSMECLEVLNISHCLLLVVAPNGRKQVVHELDSPIQERASRLREFHYCQSRSCIACQRMVVDEGIMRWYRYEDWFWRRDEVRSLDLQDYGRLFDAGCERLTSVD